VTDSPGKYPSYAPELVLALRKVERGRVGATDADRRLRLRPQFGPLSGLVFGALLRLHAEGYVTLSRTADRQGWHQATLTSQGRRLLRAWTTPAALSRDIGYAKSQQSFNLWRLGDRMRRREIAVLLSDEYETGTTLSDLAVAFRMCEGTVRNLLEEVGTPRRGTGVRYHDVVAPERLATEYAEGASVRALAARYGMTEGVVRRRLREQDVTLRRPGGRSADRGDLQ
jgi:Mor family transcriptional regulator